MDLPIEYVDTIRVKLVTERLILREFQAHDWPASRWAAIAMLSGMCWAGVFARPEQLYAFTCALAFR